MGLSSIYNRIALISPYCEIALRHLYWKNVKWLGKFNPHKAHKATVSNGTSHVDFNKVLDWLKANGVGEGSLLVIHSSFDALSCTGLTPNEIIDGLRNLVGDKGTIAMPVIRNFVKTYKDGNNVVSEYNVLRTPVSSGMLPFSLMRNKDAEISLFPLNPLCAIGPLAKDMVASNLDGDCPSPHGPNSSWKYCLDHNAQIVALGVDIEHHDTMAHVAEEAFGDWFWSDNEWYDKKYFDIIDKEKIKKRVVVKDRKDKWGTLHIAELNMCKDLKKTGIMKKETVEGIELGFVDSQKLIKYLRGRNQNGYPYYQLFK